MHEALWSLLGVFVGFALTEVTAWFKARKTAHSLRRALDGELASIARMIPLKEKTLQKAISQLAAGQFLNTASTYFPRGVYDQLLLEAYDTISNNERDCLHILFEHLRVLDQQMNDLERRFLSIKDSNSTNTAVQMAGGTLQDLVANLSTCQRLISSIQQKNPFTVYDTHIT